MMMIITSTLVHNHSTQTITARLLDLPRNFVLVLINNSSYTRTKMINFFISRYGPVQSVKYLPCKDGEAAGPGAVTVAFMDIKSACKALQTQHKLDERYG